MTGVVKVKICGITTLEDGLAAANAGADMLGFNFYRRSPRFIEPEAAAALCASLRSEMGAACPVLVGLFVNEIVGRISITMGKVWIKFVQLSGDESGEMVRELKGTGYKAIRPRSKAEALDDAAYFGEFVPTDERVPSLLLDAYHPELYGGTGEQASIRRGTAAFTARATSMLACSPVPPYSSG